MRMCEYSIVDPAKYNETYSIVTATTELMRCRIALKDFAWNDHWLMFIPYGIVKEARLSSLCIVLTLTLARSPHSSTT